MLDLLVGDSCVIGIEDTVALTHPVRKRCKKGIIKRKMLSEQIYNQYILNCRISHTSRREGQSKLGE